MKNNIVSLSGGKDSTAMLHMMLDRGEKIHSVIFFDTGWEFPAMHDHVDLVEKKTGLKIWRLQSRLPFEYWMLHRPVIARTGEKKGDVYRIGNGWPSPMRRWCTRQKVDALEYYTKPIPNAVSCVGYAADEAHRHKDNTTIQKRYPLIEYGVNEEEALKYCYDLGYTWGGLYEHFCRVSCYCCPLQKIGDLRITRRLYPDLWAKMLEMDRQGTEQGSNLGFRGYKTVADMENRFKEEDRQMELF